MNKEEYLLNLLTEECSEVIKRVSKALRFGLEDHYSEDPNVIGTDGPTNRERIVSEVRDVMCTLDLLVSEEIFPHYVFSSTPGKLDKIRRFMEYSRRTGALVD